MRRARFRRLCLGVVTVLAAGAAGAVPCTVDPAPAATLLFPYFAVDTDQCGNPHQTTVVTVLNTVSAPVLAHVTVWSNFGVPVAGFDLYLQGFDLQVLDLSSLLCSGLLPATGPGSSPPGALSEPPAFFPGCGDPVAADLSPAALASLRAYLRGQPSPSTGLCAGVDTGLAEGYLTVDVVEQCSLLDPTQPGYAAGILGADNVLTGEYHLLDPLNNFAQGFEAVHVEAHPTTFAAGDVTFYGVYVGGTASDLREPLGTSYGVPYDLRSAVSAGTELLVWREGHAGAAPFVCGAVPPWYPLPSSLIAYPERDAAGLGGLPAHAVIPRVVQRVPLQGPDVRLHPATAERGWLFVGLQRPVAAYPAQPHVGQAWVSAISYSEGRFSSGQHGDQLDSACTPGSFAYTVPGRSGP